jgi:hypothetical protein
VLGKLKSSSKREIIAIIAVVLLITTSLLGYLNYKSNQLAKQEYVKLCTSFSKTYLSEIYKLSAANTTDEIREPKIALIQSINSFDKSLSKISRSADAKKSSLLIDEALKIMSDYLSLKDKQALIDFRNPYREEYELYTQMISYAVARGLYDPGYQERFLASATKVEEKYKAYNKENFNESELLSETEVLLTKKIGEVNSICKNAQGIV